MSETNDIRLLVQALVDGELDAGAALEVERQIAADPALAKHYENMAAVKRAVQNLPRPVVSEDFASRIAALASPASPARVRRVEHAWERGNWRMLAASVLLSALLASGTTYLLTAPSPDNDVAALLASGHRRSLLAAVPVDVASSDRHTVKPWLDGRVGVSPPAVDMADSGFILLGGRVEVVGDRAVPSLVYRHNEHLITLAALPVEQSRNDQPVHVAAGGFGMVRWSGQGFSYWAISDMERAELDRFVATFRARVAQQ